MTHTPGPWKVKTTGREDFAGRIIETGQYIQTKDDETIASVYVQNHYTVYRANASLIAASPELLEACEMALRYLNYYGHGRGPEEFTKIFLTAAIAKAKGEA